MNDENFDWDYDLYQAVPLVWKILFGGFLVAGVLLVILGAVSAVRLVYGV